MAATATILRIVIAVADHDDENNDDGRRAPPPVSRLGRSGDRRYRVLSRPRFGSRDRFRRTRKQHTVAELLRRLIEHHGLTDEVRKQCVCIYWPEIVGDRIASKTFPSAFTEGTLQVAVNSSSWAHELRVYKTRLITQINDWVDANRMWLGPPPLVLDVRFSLALQQRNPLVDRDHVRRLRDAHALRVKRRPEATPPTATEMEREQIRSETSAVVDDELRAMIEHVRVKWNR